MPDAAQRAFEADPNPQSARAVLAALSRERGGALAALLPLIDDPEQDFPALCWACEEVEEGGLRSLVERAVGVAIASWPARRRWLQPRHLAAFAEAGSGRSPGPLLRALDVSIGEAPRGPRELALLEAHPQLERVGLLHSRAVRALPEGLCELEMQASGLEALARRELPRLRGLRLTGDAYGADEAAALRGATWREGLTSLAWRSRRPGVGFAALELGWPGLRRLSLSLCPWPGRPLAELAPGLRELELVAPRSLAAALPELARIELDELRLMGLAAEDLAGLTVVAEQVTALGLRLPVGELPPCPRLRELEVSGEGDLGSLLDWARRCPQLRSLSISGEPEDAVLALGQRGPWELTSLRFEPSLGFEDVWLLSAACPELERLLVFAGAQLKDVCEAFAGLARLDALVEAEDLPRAPLTPPPGLRLDAQARLRELDALLGSPLRTSLRALTLDGTLARVEAALQGAAGVELPRLEEIVILGGPNPGRFAEVKGLLWHNRGWPQLQRIEHS